MNTPHDLWSSQCEAADEIKDRYGVQSALKYLVEEKLFRFRQCSEFDEDCAAELPAFIAEVKRVFTAIELAEFLRALSNRKSRSIRNLVSVTEFECKDEFLAECWNRFDALFDTLTRERITIH